MSEKSSPDEHIPMADENDDFSEETAQGLGSGANSSVALPGKEEHKSHDTTEVGVVDSNLATHAAPSLFDNDLTPEEQEEKARLIAQVLELQNTLDDLSSRVDNVKEENLRLRSENQVLGQYIENLMAASSVFQPANEQHPTKSKRK